MRNTFVNTASVEPNDTATVIIVDDSLISLKLLEHALLALDDVHVEPYSRAVDALEALRTSGCDVLITDLSMPEMDGLELIRACRGSSQGSSVPIMVVTASTEREARQQALELGALDFLNKPLDAEEIRARTRNMIALSLAQKKLTDRSTWLASEVRRATATIASRERETILRLARAAEYRDWETGQHILRIAEYSRLIGEALGLDSEFREELALASPLHDIGKIGIPDFVLRKPDRLDAEEFALMQRHTVIGHAILSESRSKLLQRGAEVAISHHEKVDGSGYPNGLAGDAIPLSGRIVAVADVFDALTSRRPYKAAWPLADARALLAQGAGKHFDGDCLDAFFRQWSSILEVRERLTEDPVGSDISDTIPLALV
jgi:putative two-component system response regulator